MSDSGSIKIIIGASQDRSINDVFGSIESRARKMSDNIAKGSTGGPTGTTGAGAVKKQFDEIGKAAQKSAKEAEKAYADMGKAAEKTARLKKRAEDDSTRDIIRGIRDISREQDKANAKAASQAKDINREHGRTAKMFGRNVERNLFHSPLGPLGAARGLAGDLMRGAGVDFSIAGSLSRSIGIQSQSALISNEGYMKGEKDKFGNPTVNSFRVPTAVIEAEARDIGKKYSFNPDSLLHAQQTYIDTTGDMAGSRRDLSSIAQLSSATGTDPEKMALAWASVSRHIGDIPNKAAKVEGLMRMIAGQGRVGSIPIKEEAKDLGRIAAMADKFSGDKVKNIGELATIAQMSKAEGGSVTSAQAATAITSFASTFEKPARIQSMLKGGMKEDQIFDMKDGVRSKIKDPMDIIKGALMASGGDILKFGQMFKSVMGQRATNAFLTAYNSGSGHNMAAVDTMIGRYGKEATMSDDLVKENDSERQKTAEAKAIAFQGALDSVTSGARDQLLPALTSLEKPAIAAAGALAGIVKLAVENPGSAIAVAITASIAKAGIETVVRAGFENLMKTAGMASGGLALTISMATITVAAIEADIKADQDDQRDRADRVAQSGITEGRIYGMARTDREHSITDVNRDALGDIQANVGARIKLAKEAEEGHSIDLPNGDSMYIPQSGSNAAVEDKKHLTTLQEEYDKNSEILEQIRSGVLKVIITNPGDIGMNLGNGPKVYAPGRAPDPGQTKSDNWVMKN